MSDEMTPQRRLYGAMQLLLTHEANAVPPPVGERREFIEAQHALDAVIQVAAVLDEQAQAGRIPAEQAYDAAAMLMVIREYVQALPPPSTEDGGDFYADDLRAMVDALRQVHGA